MRDQPDDDDARIGSRRRSNQEHPNRARSWIRWRGSLWEAFLYERSIDIDTYNRQADRVREQMTLLKIDEHTSKLEELDVEGILAFAERVLPRAADLWVQWKMVDQTGIALTSGRGVSAG